jgi:predicted transcriptional regulator
VTSSDSLGTFLELRNMLRKADESDEQSKRRSGQSKELTESAVISVSLVREHEFPIPIHELLKESGLPIEQFTEALVAIRRADLIEVRGGDEGEIVMLTPKGRQFQDATRGTDLS